jgi:hypothetical protein
VLLLDEPFGALDAKIREELRSTIRAVQRELGITTVLVTHDQEEAFALADRIGVMNLGRLLEVGRPHDLYARPATRFVATFLGAANLVLAQQGPDAIRFGTTPVDAIARNPVPSGREHEVVTVMRPEEIEIATRRDDLACSYIARATVEEIVFTGALERLRLRLVDDPGSALLVATRTQPEQRALPLLVGDTVALGARRLHVLPTPLSSFVACATDEIASLAVVSDPLLSELATRMKTRVALHLTGAGGVLKAPAAGVPSIAGGDDAARRAQQLLAGGANEVLVTSGTVKLPTQVCIHWRGDTVRAATLAVAASVLRHIPAEAICLATTPGNSSGGQRHGALRALLDARSEAKAAHGLEVRTELIAGNGPDALALHINALEAPMLVLGVTDVAEVAGTLAPLIQGNRPMPVLLVYRGPP